MRWSSLEASWTPSTTSLTHKHFWSPIRVPHKYGTFKIAQREYKFWSDILIDGDDLLSSKAYILNSWTQITWEKFDDLFIPSNI